MALLQILRSTQMNVVSRSLCCSAALQSKQWRISQGLSANRTAEGILTDGPDYTFLDGRPTPLLQKQKLRMLKQQDYATKIVQLTSELDFAKTRYQDNIRLEQEERDNIIKNRLKPKGKFLKK
ncbi:39S ribosomal protein L52, mitochondrial [Colias croceus]|uniref:39S ribosomal protein L52, mitochondrial n=1 Tax=Colias crocea TaxID=72248 RepID=UPI001E2817F6|nr:39S ribosomal protein L52, mitochondrial [Colias croceus]